MSVCPKELDKKFSFERNATYARGLKVYGFYDSYTSTPYLLFYTNPFSIWNPLSDPGIAFP